MIIKKKKYYCIIFYQTYELNKSWFCNQAALISHLIGCFPMKKAILLNKTHAQKYCCGNGVIF